MARRRIFPYAVIVVALVVIVALLGMQYEAHRRLREQNDASRQLFLRLNNLQVDNLRLSNIVARANIPLSEVQLTELEKLRLEVQQLRARTNEVKTLQTEVRRLRGVLSSLSSNAPPNVPNEDLYPRDSWEYSGFDTPEDALVTVTWAISQGDSATYMESLTPELRSQMQPQLADGSFGDIAPLEMSTATGFRILDREPISENQVIYRIYMDGDNDAIDMVLEYVDGQWAVAGEGAAQ